jgi:hypothetical protein
MIKNPIFTQQNVSLNEPNVSLNEVNGQTNLHTSNGQSLNLNNFANTNIKPIQYVGKMPMPHGKPITVQLNSYNKTKQGKNKFNARRKSMKTIKADYYTTNKSPGFKRKQMLKLHRRPKLQNVANTNTKKVLPKVRGISVLNKQSRTQKLIKKKEKEEKDRKRAAFFAKQEKK